MIEDYSPELSAKCMEIIECDTARISKYDKLFLVIGFNKNTKDDPGQWVEIDTDGEHILRDWDYVQEIDDTEYDCIPPDRGGMGTFLLMLDQKQQDDFREKISTMNNIKVSCESVGVSNSVVNDVKFHINNNLVITKVSILLLRDE